MHRVQFSVEHHPVHHLVGRGPRDGEPKQESRSQQVGVEIVAGILVLLLAGVTAAGAVVGLLGLLTGERVGRCGRCHHVAMSVHDQMHPAGCPATAGRRFAHLMQQAPRLHHS